MLKLFIFALSFFCTYALFAQKDSGLIISFLPTYNDRPITFSNDTGSSDLPLIETLQFYISNIKLFNGSEIVFAEADSYHLLNAEDPGSLQLHLDAPDHLVFSSLSFNVGIDSTTNVSGALGGDLDPSNGMYWTWQSGYINFKLEGTDPKCPTRNHRFQFHIGGYQQPFNALQKVVLKTTGKRAMIVKVEIDKIFQHINLEQSCQIMSPNQAAVDFSNLFPTIFSTSK